MAHYEDQYDAQTTAAPHTRARDIPARPGNGTTLTPKTPTTTSNLVTGFEQVEKLVVRVANLAAELIGPGPENPNVNGKDRPSGVLNTLDAAVEIMLLRIAQANAALDAIERRLL